MSKNYFLLLSLAMFTIQISAQQFKVSAENASSVTLGHNIQQYISKKKVVDQVAYEDFSSISPILTMTNGAPALPVYSESVMVQPTGNISVEISYDSYTDYHDVSILPSKGSLKRNVDPAIIPYQFGAVYDQNAFYPGALAAASDPFIFRNTRGITISYFPFQYNPVTKVLRVYRNISVHVKSDQQSGINQIQTIASEKSEVFQAMYRNLFVNMPAYLPLSDEGEMLIITPVEYLPTLQPMIDWKTEKGTKITVATLQQTGADPISIKNFISGFYNANPNLVYVQLVGDHEQLPTYSYGITNAGENLYSDSFYGQLAGTDLFPELMIGRFSGTVEDVAAMVEKGIEYETMPAGGDWMIKAAGIGSNEGGGFGDDGESDWEHLRNIGNKLTTFGYDHIYEFYDGSQGLNDGNGSPSASSISAALNSGVGIVNYTGHGGTDVMSTGNYASSDVNSLTNQGYYPFVISVACNNGTFAGGESLCEAFTNVRQLSDNSPAGAIASCGSSILMAWSEPMQTQDEMTELITRSDAGNNKTTLGGLFYNGQISMLEAYNQSTTAREVMQTWIFFGDPSVSFRSQIPVDIIASHEEVISISGGNLNIASNTSDAVVTVTQNNILIGTAVTVEGMAVIPVSTLTSEDILKVTITKPNTVPYRGTVNVSSSLAIAENSQQFVIYPNPVSEMLFIRNTGEQLNDATIRIADANGRIISQQSHVNINGEYQVPVSQLSSGIYILSVSAEKFFEISKIAVH